MIRTAICDDEANTRAYLASLIRAQPYPCEIVEYAYAGDCLADQQEIDLLLLDIELNPPGYGIDAALTSKKYFKAEDEKNGEVLGEYNQRNS